MGAELANKGACSFDQIADVSDLSRNFAYIYLYTHQTNQTRSKNKIC